jgi:hypothetical protein
MTTELEQDYPTRDRAGWKPAPKVRMWRYVRRRNRHASLQAWLGQRTRELRGLLATLEGVLDTDPFDPEKARPVHEYFWQIRDEVDRKLHTSASDWVGYFNEDHISDGAGLFYPQADLLRSQFIPVIESTIDRIAHIQARL